MGVARVQRGDAVFVRVVRSTWRRDCRAWVCVQRGDVIVVRGCAFNVEAGLSCVCHAFNVEARRADL